MNVIKPMYFLKYLLFLNLKWADTINLISSDLS